jgi:hypothetical protein
MRGAMSLQTDTADRLTVYRRLNRRNRLVAILRLAVPALGLLVLAVLVGQIYLSSVQGRFEVGQIEVNHDTITVMAPAYSGLLEDGTTYRVWSDSASAAIDTTDQIHLNEAVMQLNRPVGIVMDIMAPAALMNTTTEVVSIAGIAHVADSTGTRASLFNSQFDYVRQFLTSEGEVVVDYADGTKLLADGMSFDATKSVWTFSNVTVTLPAPPGATATESPTE